MSIETSFLDDFDTPARQFRGIITDLFGEGIRDVAAGEYRVVPRADGPNMSVTIEVGANDEAVAYIDGDDVDDQGAYRCAMRAAWEDLPVPPAPATGTRSDLVVLEVLDATAREGGENRTRPRVLQGVAQLTSQYPSTIELARISVSAGQASVQAQHITDLRRQAVGGGASVRTSAQVLTRAQRLALTGSALGEGRLVQEAESGRLYQAVAGQWRGVGAGASGSVANPPIPLTVSSWYTLATLVGTQFSEVQFTVRSGFSALAVADPAHAQVATENEQGATSIGAPSSAVEEAASFTFTDSATGNGRTAYVRNIRLDPDGYLRFELRRGSSADGTSTATLPPLRINYRAR
ncbi:hypothetical protein GCM10027586_00730 [Kineococcus gypseus]|uniref:hypothetical protein n=1 Tax=Kineococcus gypseus TaxID=1637102 RepID=UPI003D7D12D4